MTRYTTLIAAVLLSVTSVEAAGEALRLPGVFGDNMVLQRETPVPIWGWAESGAEVTVRFAGQTKSAVADEAGRWRMTLDPFPVSSDPQTLTVTASSAIGGQQSSITNILVGEVWLCSGQSNMQMAMAGTDRAKEDIAAADYPQIRLLRVQRKPALTPQSDCEAEWSVCGPDTVRSFSAVAYFFGRDVHAELDVPVGLVLSAWGGTPVEAWTREEVLRERDDLGDKLANLDRVRRNPELMDEPPAQRQSKNWRQWSRKLGTDGIAPDVADDTWPEMELPSTWAGTPLAEFDGVVWMRKEVDLPADWAGQKLRLDLGAIDDMDDTWLNGKRVGGLRGPNQWAKPRRYMIPPGVAKAGPNVIAVRVIDTGGEGGIYGEERALRLFRVGSEAAEAISLAGPWRYLEGEPVSQLPPFPRAGESMHRTPSVLYNGMIAPLIPYAMRGVIWYQGEANTPNPEPYRTLFPAMISDWRSAWGQGDFPFYYVQLAPFEYSKDRDGAGLREAQRFALSVKNTGMAVTTDVGHPKDIHPKDKRTVGQRLALWALANTYGDDDRACSGPLYESMEVEGNRIRLRFDHAAGGLVAQGGELTHFLVAGADRQFVPATAVIDGDTVVVSSPDVPEPVAVRFAYEQAPEPNFFNAAGLPASPFCTDSW